MSDYNYYQEELDRLKIEDKTVISIYFAANYPTSNTKHMLINKDNVDLFIKFLEDLKDRMS